MLTRENYTKENIERLYAVSGNDPSLLEKTVFAFGLLEALAKVGMPFIFKGGTCLMLLLDKPKRLSTDIDIIVEPGTDVTKYIEAAGRIFPFVSQKEDTRKGINHIEKRHYEFAYDSPINHGRMLVIFLDILYETNHYVHLVKREIQNEMLQTEGENLTVQIPDVNSILGDKLTAFAPHTTGIPFGIGKELEIIKQLFDCCILFREMTSFADVAEVYKQVSLTELGYRGLDYDIQTVLKDTISSCFCIISKGGINPKEYQMFSDGIRRIRGHIYHEKLNGELFAYMACEVLYLAVCLYMGKECVPVGNPKDYRNDSISFKGAKSVNYLKKVHPESYSYLAAAVKMLENEVESIVYFHENF